MDSAVQSWPLSPAQEFFWKCWGTPHLFPPRYGRLPFLIRLRGELHLPSLEFAVNRVVERHEALRTVFSEAGEVRQLLAPFEPVSLPVADLRELAPAQQTIERNRLFQEAISMPMNSTTGPLWRVLVVRFSPGYSEFLCVGEHIILDASSQRIILAEMAEWYRAHRLNQPPKPETPASSYFEYAAEHRRRLASGELEKSIRYWIQQLQDVPYGIAFPVDSIAPPAAGMPGRVEKFTVPRELVQRIEFCAGELNVTPFTILFAGFFAWLHEVSGQNDLYVHLPIAGRNKKKWKHIVGCVAQMIRPRADLSADPEFGELIRRIQRVTLRGMRHQEVPIAAVDRRLSEQFANRDESAMKAVFAYQNALLPFTDAAGLSFDAEILWDFLGIAREAVVLQYCEGRDTLEGFLEYRSDLFDKETAQRWTRDLIRILERGTAKLSNRLSELAEPVGRVEVSAVAAKQQREPIAIVGIGCRFPGGADSPKQFWSLLREGRDAITEIPADRWSLRSFYSADRARPGKTYANRGGFISNVNGFDAAFFGISPREAAQMDPQQRLLLELAWEAVEDAGIPMESLAGTPVGVFVAAPAPDYLTLHCDRDSFEDIDGYSASGLSVSIVSNRVSYAFDLRGPSMTLDTACSGSLVAIHQACQSIWHSGCPMALAGGVQLNLSPFSFIMFSKATMLSPGGRCRAFDAAADGFVRGEGGGVVVLKPLSAAERDGDRIYALIHGIAINQDGRTPSLTIPGFASQTAAVREALLQNNVAPHLIQYVEAHGPGTQVGDPIEAHALGSSLAAGRSQPVVIGSVKTNIGHLEAAAGVAGVIKLALALSHREIPPNLHFESPNPKIPMEELKLRVPTEVQTWPANAEGAPRMAGVNSFGFGGANAHAILSEAPVREPVDSKPNVERAELLLISARSEKALSDYALAFGDYLQHTEDNLEDIAFTAAARRSHHPYRLSVAGLSRTEWAAALESFVAGKPHRNLASGRTAEHRRRRRPVFVFSGMGQQWKAMGRELFRQEPEFRKAVEECHAALQPHLEWPVADVLFNDAVDIDETRHAQVAIFAIQAGIAALWRSWGIEPEAVLGHSVGEVAAAYVAGALSLADAAHVVCARSRLQAETAGRGRMLAAGLNAVDLRTRFPFDESRVSVAAVNSPQSIALAGDGAKLERLSEVLSGAEVFNRFLRVEVPYHSPLMDPLMPRLISALEGLQPKPAEIRLISTVTGQIVNGNELDGWYWAQNMRAPVRFAEAIAGLAVDGCECFLEISAHPVLNASLKETLPADRTIGTSLLRGQNERISLLSTAGAFHVNGFPVDWTRVYPRRTGSQQTRVPSLPSYPWQRTTYWQETEVLKQFRLGSAKALPLLGERLHVPYPAWKSEVDLEHLPALRDHRIQGEVIFPFSAYAELAFEVAKDLYGEQQAQRIVDIRIEKPLILQEDSANPICLTVSADRSTITLSSPVASGFIQHGSARFAATPPEPEPLDIDAVMERCRECVEGEEVYRRLHDLGYEYGPAFRRIRRAWFGGDEHREALFEVEQPQTAELEANSETSFIADPAAIDGCLNGAPLLGGGSHAWYPVHCAESSYFRPLPQRGWGYAKISPVSGNTFTAFAVLTDAAGLPSILFDGLQYRTSETITDHNATRDLTFQPVWKAQPLDTQVSVCTQSGQRWWIFADRGGAAEQLAQRVQAEGGDAILCFDGRTGSSLPADISIAVHMRSLDLGNEEVANDPVAAQQTSSLSVAEWLPCFAGQDKAPRLHVVTRKACRIAADEIPIPSAYAVWGLGRTIGNEYPALKPRLIDIGPEPDVDALFLEVASQSAESEVVLRSGSRWISRIQPAAWTRPAGSHPYRLTIRTPGSIDHLIYAGADAAPLQPDEIRIAVAAAGLNFKDVVKTLGLIDSESLRKTRAGDALGGECSGTVVEVGAAVEHIRPGDEVIALAASAFGTLVTVPASFAVRKPGRMTHIEAATLPIAYLTAYFALVECARVKTGERVLIHSATGGVGQAAIHIARQLGLEIFATAGSPSKRDLLRQQGIAHVMDSRSLAFGRETMEASSGRGVDVVLNTLPAATLPTSLEALRPRGRLIDLSNIYTGAAVDLRAFQKGLTVTAFDLDQLMQTGPEDLAAQFREAMQFVDVHELPPLPNRSFPLQRAAEAFKLMAQSQHIGKLVLTVENAPELEVEVSESRGPRLDAAATYLVSGGTSGFGLATAQWLVECGARHIVLLSRRGRPAPDDDATVEKMRKSGATIQIVSCNVTVFAELSAAFKRIASTMPPLRGVVHSVTVYEDGTLANMDAAAFDRVFRPKAAGAWHLHRLTTGLQLDFFVLYSSIAALLGSRGQGAYAAANAYLDGLAEYRQAKGLPATSVAWGPIGEVGEVTRREWLTGYFSDLGLGLVHPAQGLKALGVLLNVGTPYAVVLSADWERMTKLPALRTPRFSHFIHTSDPKQQNSLAERLRAADPEQRAEVLGGELASMAASILGSSAERLDRAAPLTSLGLDSLMAVEFSAHLQDMGAEISGTRLLSGISINTLAAQLAPRLAAATVRIADARPDVSINPALTAQLKDRKVPLSYQQLPMWNLVRKVPGNSFFNLPASIRLKGALDPARFTLALQRLTDRHATLLATFDETTGEPVQRFQQGAMLDVPVDNIGGLSETERDALLQEQSRDFALAGFDPASDYPTRARLLRFADNDHALLLSVHHLAADGASMPILLRDGLALYQANLTGRSPALPILAWTYADYVGWQRQQWDEATVRSEVEHWIGALDGQIPALSLPLDCRRPTTPSFGGALALFEAGAELSNAIAELCQAERCTLFVTLLAGLGMYVRDLTGCEDFVLGTFVANRTRPETRNLAGCFINQIPLRMDLRGNPSRTAILERTRSTTLQALEHSELPFSLLAPQLTRDLPASHSPLQVVLIFHNELGSLDRYRISVSDLAAEFVSCENGGAKRDWTFHVFEESGNLKGWLEYDADLFSERTARQVVAQYLHTLSSLAGPRGRFAV